MPACSRYSFQGSGAGWAPRQCCRQRKGQLAAEAALRAPLPQEAVLQAQKRPTSREGLPVTHRGSTWSAHCRKLRSSTSRPVGSWTKLVKPVADYRASNNPQFECGTVAPPRSPSRLGGQACLNLHSLCPRGLLKLQRY